MATKTEHLLDHESILSYPKQYKVYLLNDDYTSMDFVVEILMKIFRKTFSQAQAIMLEVHEKGLGLCGIYSFEIAETKVKQVVRSARENGFPLKAIMEEV